MREDSLYSENSLVGRTMSAAKEEWYSDFS